MNISFNKKNHNVFARFRHSQDREIHLGYTIKDAISRMEAVIKERQYLERGIATPERIEQLKENIRQNFKR